MNNSDLKYEKSSGVYDIKPVAYAMFKDDEFYDAIHPKQYTEHIGSYTIPLYTQDQLEEARKLGMQQERALWNLSASTQEIMDTHPVKEQDVKYNVTVKWDDKITHHKNVSVDTPLHYTHPVKELTDEEIMSISETFEDRFVDTEQQWSACILDFARAILRKASEK